MNFRKIELNDVPALIVLRGQTRENAISPEELADLGITPARVVEYLQTTHQGWLCEADGKIVGFAIGDGSTGELWVIAVAPEFEGRGIGSRLLSLVETWLWAQGQASLWLWTDIDESRRAFSFYRRHGWEKDRVEDGALYLKKQRKPTR